VRVKSRAQIVQTLDHRMSNRGMGLSYEMMRCCGREAEVRYRVDRLINERTGVMREIADTVTLSSMRGCGSLGEECLCYGEAASLCIGGRKRRRAIIAPCAHGLAPHSIRPAPSPEGGACGQDAQPWGTKAVHRPTNLRRA
jgi:hypothetical protein